MLASQWVSLPSTFAGQHYHDGCSFSFIGELEKKGKTKTEFNCCCRKVKALQSLQKKCVELSITALLRASGID